MKKPEIKDKGGLTGDFLVEKAKISTKKQSRKIALKRRKRQLFGTNLDRNLAKTPGKNSHFMGQSFTIQIDEYISIKYYFSPNLKENVLTIDFFGLE